jgi:hypothetical protein
MRIDLKALGWMWRQTFWGTLIAMVFVTGLAVYSLTVEPPDYEAAGFLALLVLLMPVGLGAAYLVRRFIERLSD